MSGVLLDRAKDIESIARENLNLNAIACNNPSASLLHIFRQIRKGGKGSSNK